MNMWWVGGYFASTGLCQCVSKMVKYRVQLVQSRTLFLVSLCLFTNLEPAFSELSTNPNEGCPASSCITKSGSYCYCDRSCLLYGDCCHDAEVTPKTALDPRFSCINSGRSTFWMITSCSRSWITDQLADGVANVNEIVSLCEDPTVTRASYKIVPPPVTDGSTGLVYRNEFCARCNGLQQSNQISWNIQLDCQDITVINLEGEVRTNFTLNELLEFCHVDYYRPPSSLSNPRGCKRLPTGLISTCPEDSPIDLRENCTTFGLNLVTYGGSVYANTYCAACWNVSSRNVTCSPVRIQSEKLVINNIVVLLDVSGTGKLVSSSTRYNLIEEVCPSGSVYDAFRGSCRTLPSANCTNSTAITLVGGSYFLTSNESVFWHIYKLNVSIESVNDNGRPLVCIPSVQSTNCVPVILESSEYHMQIHPDGGKASTLVWLSDNETYSIEGTDKNGKPLICSSLIQNYTRNSTQIENVFSYPIAFDILSYIGISIDFVSCLLFLLTFFLFKKLQTFFSKLMVNFVLSILLGDLIFLFGGPLFTFLSLPEFCIIVGIVLHYVYMCRFSWMTVMGSEMIRRFANIKKLNKSAAENWKLLTLYILLGWLSPLVIVIPTIIVNFTVEDSVSYGVGSSCWINQHIALIVTFVVPVGLSIIFNIIAFIVVMVMIGWIRRRPMASSHDPEERKKQLRKDFRFAVALLTVTGLSWLFGFLALFSSDLSWAWYLFIIFNTTQAVTVLVAFLFTKQVFHLYWSLLCFSKTRRSETITSSKPSTADTKV